MLDNKIFYVDAVKLGHDFGFTDSPDSYLFGEGVTYPNGADGTTSGLAQKYPDKIMDVPVSEAAFTAMAVGLATSDVNAIVHHGRVEFALLAMDQILTQAAKWEFMFQNDNNCRFGMRLNIGRQWGNGPQHTSSYSSLFYNTPGLDILWPSTPEEAFVATYLLHRSNSPLISMEHRYLFKTQQSFDVKGSKIETVESFPVAKIYGSKNPNIVILTYGDGLVEALKASAMAGCEDDVSIICFTAFLKDRKISRSVLNVIEASNKIILVDTSNYTGGILQALVGKVSENVNLAGKISVFSPPFTPCPTAPKLTESYYPRAREIAEKILQQLGVVKDFEIATFDENHLPVEFDFSEIDSHDSYFYDS